jgi:hypothetical protein
VAKTHFEWDPKKDLENQQKSGTTASGRLTAAFSRSGSHTARRLFGSSGRATGEKGRESMSGKVRYTSEPLGKLKVVPDFLPSPEDLAFRDDGIKVTIALSRRSVDFFKGEARKHGTQYQRMIRRLLDAYTERHASASKRAS